MNQPLVFGVMSDCQYADADNTSSYVPGTHHFNDNRFRLAPKKLQEAVESFNGYELDFVIHLGDFIDRNLADANEMMHITSGLRAPLLHVLGNHDFMGSEGKAGDVYAQFGLESPYYSTVVKGVRLIVLDTNELGVIKYVPGTDDWRLGSETIERLKKEGAVQAYEWNGGVGEKQLEWLKGELAQAANDGQKVILFSHHPVFPPNPLNALDDEAILHVIDEYSEGILAYINGHNHVGAYGARGGKPYITVPGMLQGETNAFGVVTTSDTHITIDGHDRMIDMSIEL